MAKIVTGTLPAASGVLAPERRPKRHVRVERLLITVCFAYLLAFMGWGEVTNLRLQAQERKLASEVRLENEENAALRHRVHTLHESSGVTSAIQAQLGLAPKGEIPVIVKGN